MCGIFALLNNYGHFEDEKIKDCFEKGKNRGPEHSELLKINQGLELGFHRLAINGLNEKSNQPMWIDKICLICNGEIYNFKELFSMIGETPVTNSDCEIIIHLYKRFGIEYAISLLDGYFSFIIYDATCENKPVVYVARDAHGVRPLYIMKPSTKCLEHDLSQSEYDFTCDTSTQIFGFASDLKSLSDFLTQDRAIISHDSNIYAIQQYPPGTYSKLIYNYEFSFEIYAKKYSSHYFDAHSTLNDNHVTVDECYAVHNIIYQSLCDAVKKRVVGTTDRPIACLLSGGLDSSLIAALVTKYYNKQLETYSIGMEGGEDLKYARMVAEHIGSKHTEIVLSEDEFFNAIPEVIKTIESYDTTSVRASVGNYLVSKYISEHSDAKVIFNGDGSDEVTGGYLYFHAAPDALSFDCEIKRLLSDIHLFDVLRSDKSISSHGLEPRTPFLDRQWVQTYMSIPLKYRYTPAKIEKWLLRQSFKIMDPNLLPEKVLWRTKEAFSDGVSSQAKSWYEIINDRVNEFVQGLKFYYHLQPKTKEQFYYRTLFDHYYPNCANVVPYFWMPRFVNANDASARTLNVYKNAVEQ
jgi:asparagine synthase (glutamine-hydrolysing)